MSHFRLFPAFLITVLTISLLPADIDADDGN